MSIENYLQQHYRTDTVVLYTREIRSFIQFCPNAKNAQYKQVVNYIGEMRNRKAGLGKLSSAVQAIKQYYYYLIHTGQRQDHPCCSVRLRDRFKKPIQLQELFSEKQLETLLDRHEHFKINELKNKVIVSLLIYQGLFTGEIVTLRIEDVNLHEGTIYVQGTATTNSRTIGLRNNQIMLLHRYMNEIRPKLIEKHYKFSKKPWTSNELILSWQGSPENGEGVSYLIETFKPLFPDKNLNPKTIRQSVIRNLLDEGKDIRIVQQYMGHRSPDTTKRYQQIEVKTLQEQILRYHPIQ
jgi:integrase/recombinase XerD